MDNKLKKRQEYLRGFSGLYSGKRGLPPKMSLEKHERISDVDNIYFYEGCRGWAIEFLFGSLEKLSNEPA